MDARSYAAILKVEAQRSAKGWHLAGHPNPSEQDERAELKATLEVLGAVDQYDRLISGQHPLTDRSRPDDPFNQLLTVLAEDFHRDIGWYTHDRFKHLSDATVISFLPLRDFAGFCLHADMFGRAIDGYLIGLHEGLYFCLKLLTKAMVLRSLEGDLAQFGVGSGRYYRIAQALFREPNAELLQHINFNDLPPELAGKLSAFQSHATMIGLQFVVLHEFGHAVANDFDLMGLYRLQLVAETAGAPQPVTTSEQWDAEYRADAFALTALCSPDRPAATHWTNFLVVYAFFLWLADIEAQTGRPLCPLHPQPAHRAAKLLELMRQLVPEYEGTDLWVSWLEEAFAAWTGSVANKGES